MLTETTETTTQTPDVQTYGPPLIAIRIAFEALYGTAGTREVNELVRKYTAFPALPLLLGTVHANYRPSIYVKPRSRKAVDVLEAAECLRLADAYDALAAAIGDSRRAFRGL